MNNPFNYFSEEAISYRKEKASEERAKDTAEKLCNIDNLINEKDFQNEFLNLNYYNSLPGIKVDPLLNQFLSANQSKIANSTSALESLKNDYISQVDAIQVQEKYLKEQKKSIKGYKSDIRKAKQNKLDEVSPIEYFFNLGKSKSIREAIRTAKSNYAKAKSKKRALSIKISGMKSKLKNIVTKINKEKEKIAEVANQIKLYKDITSKQFEIANHYIAVGTIAKQTGLADGSNSQNKALLESLPGEEAKNLLDVLSNFPVNQPPETIIISFSGNGLTEKPNKTAQDIEMATKALEKLQLKFNKGELLESSSNKGVTLLSSTNKVVNNHRNTYINNHLIINDGKVISQSELNNKMRQREERSKIISHDELNKRREQRNKKSNNEREIS